MPLKAPVHHRPRITSSMTTIQTHFVLDILIVLLVKMKTIKSIPRVRTVHKYVIHLLFGILLFGIYTQALLADHLNLPQATFDHTQITALKVNPTITGYARNLTLPLQIEVTASSS